MPVDSSSENTVYLPPHYKTLDLSTACLFTGAPQSKTNGEHVIPDWMQRLYQLQQRPVEMGESPRMAKVMLFRAPAAQEPNNFFGMVEQRIKKHQATADELHLWSKKISVGMSWNHHQMSRNNRHPNAPEALDERQLRFALMDFHNEFKQFRAGTYKRTGPTLVLPTKISGFWLAHAFGAVVDTGHSDTHDAMCPFAFLAVSHGGKLIVSALYNAEMSFETGRLNGEWFTSGLNECTDDLRIRAGLAVVFAESISTPFVRQPEYNNQLLDLIAFQLGVIFTNSADGQYYRRRTPGDLPPSPVVSPR